MELADYTGKLNNHNNYKDILSEEKVKSVNAKMKEMDGYCDCKVLLNCYEEYNIV